MCNDGAPLIACSTQDDEKRFSGGHDVASEVKWMEAAKDVNMMDENMAMECWYIYPVARCGHLTNDACRLEPSIMIGEKIVFCRSV